jgi:hypothetical protein
MNRNINRVIKDLNNNILPPELLFVKSDNSNCTIDLSKIQYNTFYKTPQYFDSLFPDCIKNLPGYENILNKLVEENKDMTLSKAMDERKKFVNERETIEDEFKGEEYNDVRELFDENNF